MSSYSDLILAHGSLRWYARLGEGSGTTLDDVGPNNLDGTYAASGITYGVAGAIANDANTAVTFAGTSDAATVADNNALDLGNTFSLECWVKRSATLGTDQYLVAKVNAYTLAFNTADRVYLAAAGVGRDLFSSVAITDTNWHHIVVCKDGATTRKCYVDGADVTSLDTSRTFSDSANLLRIGHLAAGSGRYTGSLDEIVIYGAVLTPAEVRQHYDTGRGERQEADSVTATDSQVLGPEAAKADSVSASDQASVEPGLEKADSVTATDALSVGPEAAQADSVAVTDALAAEGAITLGDSVTVTDDASPDLIEAFEEAVGDSVMVTDDVSTDLTESVAPAGGGWIAPAPRRRPPTLRHEMALRDYVLVTDDLEVKAELDPELRQEELAVLLLA